MADQWNVQIDYVKGQGWEATLFLADGEMFNYANEDVRKMFADIAADLETESNL